MMDDRSQPHFDINAPFVALLWNPTVVSVINNYNFIYKYEPKT